MKNLVTRFIFLFIFGLFATAYAQVQPIVQANAYTEGQIILKFKPNTPVAMQRIIRANMQAYEAQYFKLIDAYLWEVPQELTINNQRLKGILDMVNYLNSLSDIAYAEPNYLYQLLNTPNDPLYPQLWGMEKIDMSLAWESTTGSSEVVVGVIDTGIDYTHEDLVNNIWQNLGEDADGDGRVWEYIDDQWVFDPDDENGIDDDGNGYIDDFIGWDFRNNDNNPMDGHSHGTHCAGTIGATGNNNIGIVGVNWQIQLAALQIFSAFGGTNASAILAAISYSIDNNMPISSNSWGGGPYSAALNDLLNVAEANNQLFIAAAGNEGTDNDGTVPIYPASYEQANIIAVGASNSYDNIPYFSCYGLTSVDVFAPGSGIFSTEPNNTYNYKNGTSMAAPHVAGLAALILSQCPEASYSDVKAQIMDNVDVLPAFLTKCVSGGRINAFNSLNDAYCCDVVSNFSATVFCEDLPTQFTNSSSNATSYIWNFDDGNSSTAANPSHVYTNAGTYTVSLTASNGTCSNTYLQEISVNAPTDATFTYSLNGYSLNLYANQQQVGYNYTYTANATTIGSTANTSYTFATAGEYNICLSINNATCSSQQHCQVISILDPECTVQQEIWRHYLNGDKVICLLEVGDWMYVGTDGNGLVKINTLTNERIFFNTANSDLPSNFVYALLESSSGEIFVGTYGGGLAKFDGESATGWTIYNTSNSDLPDNNVRALLESSSGDFFVGTSSGLARFDGESATGWTIYNTSNSDLPAGFVRTLLESSNGEIYVGIDLGGLAKFDGESATGWTIYNTSNSDLPNDRVISLLESSSNGDIVVGTYSGGLARFDGESATGWTIYNTSNSDLPDNYVRAILESSSGDFFVLTGGGNLARFDGESATGWTIYNETNSDLPSYSVWSILESSNGDIVVGTSNSGLAKFNGENATGWTIYNITNSDLTFNYVNALLENSSGGTIIGINGSGLAKFDGESATGWPIYNTSNSDLPSNIVNSVFESSNGDIFVGTDVGLAVFDGESAFGWTIYNTSNSDLPSNIVNSVFESSSGDIFVGTDGGIAKFDGSSATGWTIYNTSNSDLPSNIVNSVFESSSGDIFIGTDSGIARFDGESAFGWTIYNEINSGLSNNSVQALLESSSGEIFVGTNAGLSILTPSQTTNITASFTTPSDLCINEVISFSNTSVGAISYEWQVNNTTIAISTDFTYTFSEAGTYVVSLIASDDNDCQDIYSETITVSDSCVYPGDANNDGVVNGLDFLAIGLAFGETGVARDNTNIDFSPKYAEDWDNSFSPDIFNGVNYKYVDSDGDASINFSDTIAVVNNYGLSHPAGLASINPTSTPEALISPLIGSYSLYEGTLVSIPLQLNSSFGGDLEVYGINFIVNYDGINPTVDFSDSELGTLDLDLMGNYMVDTTAKQINIALTRINQANVSCNGCIVGYITVLIEDVPIGDPSDFVISISDPTIIDNQEVVIPTGGESINVTAYSVMDVPPILVQARAYLQGTYNPPSDYTTFGQPYLMSSLYSNNLLPLSQPFNTTPWNYTGIEAVATPNDIPENAVDWVLLEVRDVTGNTVIEQRAAFILADGHFASPSGQLGLDFFQLSEGESYHLVVRPRNHLAVMSRSAIMVSNGYLTYDFSISAEQAKLGNQVELSDGIWGLYTGDVDGNGIVNVRDFNQYANQNGAINQYLNGDLNWDGRVTIDDYNLYLPNASLIGPVEIRY